MRRRVLQTHRKRWAKPNWGQQNGSDVIKQFISFQWAFLIKRKKSQLKVAFPSYSLAETGKKWYFNEKLSIDLSAVPQLVHVNVRERVGTFYHQHRNTD